MSVLIPIERRIDVTYAVCEKLHEWFGDVTNITYDAIAGSGNGYRIFFDGKDVGTFNELIDGINRLFFSGDDYSWAKNCVARKLKKRLRYHRRTSIVDIARLIVSKKVSFKYKTI